MGFNWQCHREIWYVKSKYVFRSISLERASHGGYSLVAYFFTGLNNFKLKSLWLFKVMNDILDKISPLETKTVFDLLQKSSVIGSALQVLEKVPQQFLVCYLRNIVWGWNSVGGYVKFSYRETIWPEKLKKNSNNNNSKDEENGNEQA